MKRLFVAAMLLGKSECCPGKDKRAHSAGRPGETPRRISGDIRRQGRCLSATCRSPKSHFRRGGPSRQLIARLLSHGPGMAARKMATGITVPQTEVLRRDGDDYRGSLSRGNLAALPLGRSMPGRGFKHFRSLFTKRLVRWRGKIYSQPFAPNDSAERGTLRLQLWRGPKIAWRQKKWETWLHGMFGRR